LDVMKLELDVGAQLQVLRSGISALARSVKRGPMLPHGNLHNDRARMVTVGAQVSAVMITQHRSAHVQPRGEID